MVKLMRAFLHVYSGQKKHKFTLVLPSEEAGNVLTVGHLSKQAEVLTEVPADCQRLIHKGQLFFLVLSFLDLIINVSHGTYM